ncbi:MAG: DNA polymerase-4 [Francisellaceae bacterium]|jgi:DNA polymerase-4
MKKDFYCPDTKSYWPKCIAHVDLVSFFASVECLDNPVLRGKPIAVTNGDKGTTIITSSYQARDRGIKTGWKLKDALAVCPELIRCPSRPERYTAVSTSVMLALHDITPVIQVFSCDEAFLDLTSVLHYHGSVAKIAKLIRRNVFESSGGLRCSIGISNGILLAKYLAKTKKSYTTIVAPDKIKDVIAEAKIGDICGVGKKIEKYLNDHGVYKCKDMRKLPMDVMARRFGDMGRRIFLVCNGEDPYPVITEVPIPKSLSHSKILPPATQDINLVYAVMKNLVERLAARLRKNHTKCKKYQCYIHTDLGWLSKKYMLIRPSYSSKEIWSIAEKLLSLWSGQPAYQLGIAALELEEENQVQFELNFTEESTKDEVDPIDLVRDQINQKFGKNTLISGTELMNKDANMVSVIAPSWQPVGGRQSI